MKTENIPKHVIKRTVSHVLTNSVLLHVSSLKHNPVQEVLKHNL